MSNYIDEINKNLAKSLDILMPDKFPKEIYDAMEYSLMAGGKRVRPQFLLLACEAVGGNVSDAIPFACAVEMIHTYSLIHDDLPAIDNDDFRRGKPTNHIKFGEAMAILAGDALLNGAYEIMALNNTLAFKEIAKAAGVSGMIGGQTVDILSENKEISMETLLYIHNNKTGALLSASMSAGAILGGASTQTTEKIKEAGKFIGLAFQIKDDLLDIQGNSKELGKPTNSDEKNKKSTYVSINGIEKSQTDFEEFTKKAVEILDSLNLKNDGLQKLALSLLDRSR